MDSKIIFILITASALTISLLYVTMVQTYFRMKRDGYTRSDFIKRQLPLFIASAVGIFVLLREIQSLPTISNDSSLDAMFTSLAESEATISCLSTEIAILNAGTPVPGDNGSYRLSALQATVQANSDAINSFESLVLTEPENIVSLPLVQRDLAGLDTEIDTLENQIDGLRELMTETASQNRWVIGTLALGILALVVPVIRSETQSSPKDE